ncbi:MAG: hypothetical protein EOP11_06865 [Proteobacteria bacterium]|nr:MAG: hypothetical protein EOP11_06865 [Pseudomonadota bacterium]
MAKNFWIALMLLSGFFAGGFAIAQGSAPEERFAGPAMNWYVIALANEPAICGQTSAGQFLCLHPEVKPASRANAPSLIPASQKLEPAKRLLPLQTYLI